MIDTIILDLDGTFVSSTTRRAPSPALKYTQFENLYVYLRPYARACIRLILQKFKHIYVWSDSELIYIKYIIEQLFGARAGRVEHVFVRRDCDNSTRLYGRKKDFRYLKKATGQFIKNMLIIEDSPQNIPPSQNHIFVKSLDFENGATVPEFTSDTELKRVMEMLDTISRPAAVMRAPLVRAPVKRLKGVKSVKNVKKSKQKVKAAPKKRALKTKA